MIGKKCFGFLSASENSHHKRYSKVLREETVESWSNGSIAVHGSLLSKAKKEEELQWLIFLNL